MKSNIVWQTGRILALHDATPTVRTFTVQYPQAPESYGHGSPGSHIQVHCTVEGRQHTRSYSVLPALANDAGDAGDPWAKGMVRFAVKRLDNGRGGSKAMWQLQVGDALALTLPQNHFALDLAAPAYLLVAGGIGITPLWGMAQTLAQRQAPVTLLYAARSGEELAFLEPLQTLLGERLRIFVSAQGQRIDFRAEFKSLAAQVPTASGPGTQMYFCGPSAMLEDARLAWGSCGLPLANLRYETFGSSGRWAPEAFRVKVARHGIDMVVDADTGLLDALEQQGLQCLSDCRRGECGLCAMDVLDLKGEIDHRDVFFSDAEKADNHRICVCVSRVVGEITLDSAFRGDF